MYVLEKIHLVIYTIFITRDSEVIMFSPCVFVCLCVSVYVCHHVCPDDLTTKDRYHMNNILQVYCLGCLVVQVMFHAFMASFTTSQGHKVGQIFEIDISPSIFELERRSKAQNVENANGIFSFRYNFR